MQFPKSFKNYSIEISPAKSIVSIIIVMVLIIIFINTAVFAPIVQNAVRFTYPYMNTTADATNTTQTADDGHTESLVSVPLPASSNTSTIEESQPVMLDQVALTPTKNIAKEGYGTVIQTSYNPTVKPNYDLEYNGVHVRNKTGMSIDLKKYVDATPSVNIELGSKSPQVLLYHTHTSESFLPSDEQPWELGYSTHSNDSTQNIVSSGNKIEQALVAGGINTVHNTAQHDTTYSGSYSRSRTTIEQELAKNQDMEVVIDVHRDAITPNATTKVSPTVEIEGQKAAQIMLVVGCEVGEVTNYPNWEENFIFALDVQTELERRYPGLARPLLITEKKYNQDLSNGAFLVEIGSDGNTLAQADYAAQLFGEVLKDVLASMN